MQRRYMDNKPLLWVCSLQYSPIYKSHCCALGRQAEKNGYRIRYLFSNAYSWMLSDDIREKTVFIGNSVGILSSVSDGFGISIRSKLKDLIKKEKPDYVYFYNFHPFLNYYIASLVKKYNCTFIQHVQEPYVEEKQVYRGTQQFWLNWFEYLQEQLLKKTDIAIVSSERSHFLFLKRYPFFSGKLLTIPLMYEDQATNPDGGILKRRYITFIGPPVPAKGTDIFLQIVRNSHEKKFPYQFQLITRKLITDEKFFHYPNLQITYQEKISDEEMGNHLRQSLMVVTPYLVATQSSVVLTSFMFGTPALSSNVGGLPEFVSHRKTGYILAPTDPIDDWIGGIIYIFDNFNQMSDECKKFFIENFSERNWPKYFKFLFQK